MLLTAANGKKRERNLEDGTLLNYAIKILINFKLLNRNELSKQGTYAPFKATFHAGAQEFLQSYCVGKIQKGVKNERF